MESQTHYSRLVLLIAHIKLSLITISLLVVIGLVHLSLYLARCDSNYIGAFGAIMTVFGILTTFSHSILPQYKIDMILPVRKRQDVFIEGGFPLGELVSESNAQEKNEEHIDRINEKYRPMAIATLISIIGTVIWAYAWIIPLPAICKG